MTAFVERERVTTAVPLGVRFWDVAADAAATGPLRVVATETTARGPARSVPAVPTPSGAYAFPGLGGPGVVIGPATVATRACRIDVTDSRGWVVPLSLPTDLPRWQLAPLVCVGSTPAAVAVAEIAPSPFLPLFPTPARPTPAGRAVVVADLETASGSPARWALVVVRAPAARPTYGVAGADGRVAVVLPWPEPATAGLGSPVTGTPLPLHQQSWAITVVVHSDPAVAADPQPPDLCAVLAQRVAHAVPDDPVLRYGRTTALRSAGRSTLGLTPAP